MAATMPECSPSPSPSADDDRTLPPTPPTAAAVLPRAPNRRRLSLGRRLFGLPIASLGPPRNEQLQHSQPPNGGEGRRRARRDPDGVSGAQSPAASAAPKTRATLEHEQHLIGFGRRQGKSAGARQDDGRDTSCSGVAPVQHQPGLAPRGSTERHRGHVAELNSKLTRISSKRQRNDDPTTGSSARGRRSSQRPPLEPPLHAPGDRGTAELITHHLRFANAVFAAQGELDEDRTGDLPLLRERLPETSVERAVGAAHSPRYDAVDSTVLVIRRRGPLPAREQGARR